MRQRISLFKRSNGIYYILDRTTPKDIWRSTGKTVKSEARKVLTAYRTLRPATPEPTPRLDSSIRLSEFEKEFMAYAKQNYAAGSQDIFRRAFLYLRQLAGDPPLNTLNMHLIDRFKTGRLETRSAVSVNIELRSLRTLMATAVRWGYLDKNPFTGLKLVPVADKAPRFLTYDEFSRLHVSITQQWLKDVVLFAIHTGARRSEVVNLKWDHVDLMRKVATFESDGVFRMKAGKRRTIPLNEEVYLLLSRLKELQACEYVFCLNGRRIDQRLVTQKFRNAVKRAGLREGAKFHSLRATFASWLVMKGAPIYSVSKLLGHADVSTTQKYYAHLSPDTLHDIVNKITISEIDIPPSPQGSSGDGK